MDRGIRALTAMQHMLKLAGESLDLIERDGAQPLTDRQKQVIMHWMVRAMVDVRNATLDEQIRVMAGLLKKL